MLNKLITKLFLIFAGLIFLCGLGSAQPTGYSEHQGQGLDNNDIINLNGIFTDQIIFVVSDSGSVFVSFNNGEIWTRLTESPTHYYDLNKAHAYGTSQQKRDGLLSVSSDSLWLVGHGGIISFTSNGGANWIQQASGITGDIRAVDFPDNHNGWAADLGGNIIHTTNAGTNWVMQTTINLQPYAIYFYDLLHGWAGGFHGKISYTSDGGATWVDRTPPNRNTLADVWKIQFIDQNTGWMAGTNFSTYMLFRTTNGGVQWDSCSLNPSPLNIYGLSFVNALTGYACGENNIFKTTNGGVNWIPQTLPAGTPWLYDIQFANPDTGFAVGQNAAILYTTSGGDPIGIIPISGNVPKTFKLYQNYPNPFNPATTIKFDLQKKSGVKLMIYDAAGRTIQTESKDNLNPGSYEYKWDASNYASGIYFYKVLAEGFTETKKMVLVK